MSKMVYVAPASYKLRCTSFRCPENPLSSGCSKAAIMGILESSPVHSLLQLLTFSPQFLSEPVLAALWIALIVSSELNSASTVRCRAPSSVKSSAANRAPCGPAPTKRLRASESLINRELKERRLLCVNMFLLCKKCCPSPLPELETAVIM